MLSTSLLCARIYPQSWRRHDSSVRLYPVHNAWQEYEPVEISGTAVPISIPDETLLRERCNKILSIILSQELSLKIEEIEREDGIRKDESVTRNRIGILYARYGFLYQTKENFKEILEKEEFSPARINLGNINLMSEYLIAARGLVRISRSAFCVTVTAVFTKR